MAKYKSLKQVGKDFKLSPSALSLLKDAFERNREVEIDKGSVYSENGKMLFFCSVLIKI